MKVDIIENYNQIFDDYLFEIKPYFLFQRALKGKTNSYRAGNSSILSSDVIPELLKQIKEEFPDFNELTVFILSLQIDDIKKVLSKFRVFHDNWISEKKLYEKSKGKSMFDEVINILEKNNYFYYENLFINKKFLI